MHMELNAPINRVSELTRITRARTALESSSGRAPMILAPSICREPRYFEMIAHFKSRLRSSQGRQMPSGRRRGAGPGGRFGGGNLG